uniref:Uncharacterized protein n=1 Tax=Cannabis sativa TaxID=3483 RepID=A0A803QGU7_CANSA
MDLNQDLLPIVAISVEGGSIPSVKRSLVRQDQIKAPMVTSQLEEALETILKNDFIVERYLLVETRRGEGVKIPPPVQAYTESIWNWMRKPTAFDLMGCFKRILKLLASVSCHRDPLSEEEEILKRFTATYPDMGKPGASTSKRGNEPFCILRTPSLGHMSQSTQGGFDKYFLGINHRRYPMEDYIDKVDQIVRSLRNPGTPSDTVKLLLMDNPIALHLMVAPMHKFLYWILLLTAEQINLQKRATQLSSIKIVEIAEGVRQPSSSSPVFDQTAVSQNLVPNVGTDIAPYAVEMLNSMSLSVSKLTSEKWHCLQRGPPKKWVKTQAVSNTKKVQEDYEAKMDVEEKKWDAKYWKMYLDNKAKTEQEVEKTVRSFKENLSKAREEKDRVEARMMLQFETIST